MRKIAAVSAGGTPYAVEILRADGKARRFTMPLFLTPDGFVHAFPETASACFEGSEAARHAASTRCTGMNYVVKDWSSVKISRRFKLWHERVKPIQNFKESRSSSEKSFELFMEGGWGALRKKYSKPNSLRLLKKFVAEGRITQKQAFESRIAIDLIQDFSLSELTPLLEQAWFHGCDLSDDVKALVLSRLNEMAGSLAKRLSRK